jgi:hypothetical protein
VLKVVLRIAGARTTAEQQQAKQEWGRYKLDDLPEQDSCAFLTSRATIDISGGRQRIKVATISQRANFWDMSSVKAAYPWLSKAAKRLLRVTITTGAAERNWSQWGLVAMPLRNRLLMGRAEKLVYVRGNLLTSANVADNELTMDLMELADEDE